MRVSNFSPRPDALALFQRTQSQTWDLYSVHDVLWFLVPIAIVTVAAFSLLYWMGSRTRPSSFSMLRRSRLVGRPAPRSRTATATTSSRGGGGGLLSI